MDGWFSRSMEEEKNHYIAWLFWICVQTVHCILALFVRGSSQSPSSHLRTARAKNPAAWAWFEVNPLLVAAQLFFSGQVV